MLPVNTKFSGKDTPSQVFERARKMSTVCQFGMEFNSFYFRNEDSILTGHFHGQRRIPDVPFRQQL
jgi:hypothetical protein